MGLIDVWINPCWPRPGQPGQAPSNNARAPNKAAAITNLWLERNWPMKSGNYSITRAACQWSMFVLWQVLDSRSSWLLAFRPESNLEGNNVVGRPIRQHLSPACCLAVQMANLWTYPGRCFHNNYFINRAFNNHAIQYESLKQRDWVIWPNDCKVNSLMWNCVWQFKGFE